MDIIQLMHIAGTQVKKKLSIGDSFASNIDWFENVWNAYKNDEIIRLFYLFIWLCSIISNIYNSFFWSVILHV